MPPRPWYEEIDLSPGEMQEAERLGISLSAYTNVFGFRRALADAHHAAVTAFRDDEIAAYQESGQMEAGPGGQFRTERDVIADRDRDRQQRRTGGLSREAYQNLSGTQRMAYGTPTSDFGTQLSRMPTEEEAQMLMRGPNLQGRYAPGTYQEGAYSPLSSGHPAMQEMRRIHSEAAFGGARGTGFGGPADPFVGATSGSAPQSPSSGGIYTWAATNLGMTMNQVDLVLGAEGIQAGGRQTLQQTKALATYHKARGGGVSIKARHGDVSPYTAHASTVAEHQLLAQGRHISDIREVREGEYYSGQRAGPISTLGAIPGVAVSQGVVTTGAKPSRMAKAMRLGMQQYQVFYEGPGVGQPQLSQIRAQGAQVPETVQRVGSFVALSRTTPEGASYRDPEAFGVPVRHIPKQVRLPSDVTPTIREGQIYRGGEPIPAYKGHAGFDLGPHYQSVRVSRVSETQIRGEPYLSVELAARQSKSALVAGKSAGLKGGDVTQPGLQEQWGTSYFAGDVRDIYQLGAGVAHVATPEERERFFPGVSQFETFGTEQQEAFRNYLMQPGTIQERWAETPQQYRHDDPIVQEKLKQGMLQEVDKSGAPQGSFWGIEKAIGMELPIGMQFTSAWQWRKQTIGLEEKEMLQRFHPRFVEKYGGTAEASRAAASNIGQAYLANRGMREMGTFGIEDVAGVQGQLEETAAAALTKRGLEPGSSVFQMQYPQEFMRAMGQHKQFSGRGMRFDLPGGRGVTAPNPAAALQYVGSGRPGVELRGIASNIYNLIDAQLAERGGIYRLGGQQGGISEEDLGGLSIKSASELQQRALGEQIRGGIGSETPGVADIVGSQAWRRSMAGLQMGGARFGGQMRIGEELPTTRWAGGRGVLRPMLESMGMGGKGLRQLERQILHGKGPGLDVLAQAYPGLTEAQYKMVLGYMSPMEYAKEGFGTAKEYFAKYGAVGGISRGVVQAMGKDVDVDPLGLLAMGEYTKRRGGGFDYEQLTEGKPPSGAQIQAWARSHGAREVESEIRKVRAVTSPEQARELIAGMGTSKTWDEMAETTLEREQIKLGTGGIYNLTLRAMQQQMRGTDPTSTAARMELGTLSLSAIDQQAVSAQMSKALDIGQTLNIATGGAGRSGYVGEGRWYGLGSAFRVTAKSLWDVPELSARTRAAASLDPSVVGRKPVFDLAHAIKKGDTQAAFGIMSQHIGGGSLEEIQAVSPWMGETLGRATERGVRQAGEVRPTASGARVYLPGEEEYAGAERADLSKQLVHALGSQNISPEQAVEGLLSSNLPGHREQAFQIAGMMDIPIDELIGKEAPGVYDKGTPVRGVVAATVQAAKEAVTRGKVTTQAPSAPGGYPDITTPAWLQGTASGIGVDPRVSAVEPEAFKTRWPGRPRSNVQGLNPEGKSEEQLLKDYYQIQSKYKEAREASKVTGAAVVADPTDAAARKRHEAASDLREDWSREERLAEAAVQVTQAAGGQPPKKPPSPPVAVAAVEPEQRPIKPEAIDLTVDYAATKPIAYGETPRERPDLTPTDEWLMNTPEGIQMARLATEAGINITTLPKDPGRARQTLEKALGASKVPAGARTVGGVGGLAGFGAVAQQLAGSERGTFGISYDPEGVRAWVKTAPAPFSKDDPRIGELEENAALLAAFNKSLKPASEWTDEYVKELKKTVKAVKPFAERIERLKEGAIAGTARPDVAGYAAGLPLYGKGGPGERGLIGETQRQLDLREARALIAGGGGGPGPGGGGGGGGFGGLWTPPTPGRPTGGGILGAGAAGLGKMFSGWELMRLQRYWSILGAPVFNEQIPAAAQAEMGAYQAGVSISGIQPGQVPGGAAGGLMTYEAQKQAALVRSGQIGYAAYGAGGPSFGRDIQGLLGPSAAWALQAGAVATMGGTALGALGVGGAGLSSMGAASATVGLPVTMGLFTALGLNAARNYTTNRADPTLQNQMRLAAAYGGQGYRADETGFQQLPLGAIPDLLGALSPKWAGGQGVSFIDTFRGGPSGLRAWTEAQVGAGTLGMTTPLTELGPEGIGAGMEQWAALLEEQGGVWKNIDQERLAKIAGAAAPYLQEEFAGMDVKQLAADMPELMEIMAQTGQEPQQFQELASQLRLGLEGGAELLTSIGRMPAGRQAEVTKALGQWAPMVQLGMSGEDLLRSATGEYREARPSDVGGVPGMRITQMVPSLPTLDLREQARMGQILPTAQALMGRGRDLELPDPDASEEEKLAWLNRQYEQLPRSVAGEQLGGTFMQMGISPKRADLAAQAAERVGGMTGIRGTQAFLGGDRFVASMIGQANVGGVGAEAGQVFKDSMLAALQSWMPSEEFKKISAMADAIKPVIETATGLPMGTTQMWEGFAGQQMMKFRMQGAFDKEGRGLDEDLTARTLALAEEKGTRGLQLEEQVLRAQLQRRQEQRAGEQLELQGVSQFGGTFSYPGVGTLETRGSFAIQEELRNLSRIWEDFTQDYNNQSRQLAYNQFMENIGVQQARMPVQFGWQREDLAFQGQQAAMQFGWQMEDIEENLRFASGRQRRQILKQQERAAVMFGMGAGRRETLGGRIDVREQWAEEDIERQRRHYEERFALGDEFQDRQRQYIEERRMLEDELQIIREFNAQYAMQAAQEDLEFKTRINAELKVINAAYQAIVNSTADEVGHLQTMITTVNWLASAFEEGGEAYEAWAGFVSYIVSSLAEAQETTVDLWEY